MSGLTPAAPMARPITAPTPPVVAAGADAAAAAQGFDLSEADFAALARLIHQQTGIHLPPGKRLLMQTRLAKRLRACGMSSFAAYRALIESGRYSDEVGRMISALTTNVTRFRREPHHFDDLARNVLPGLVSAAREGRRVRLWSAGCATGEEPYTLAFEVLRLCPEAPRLDLRILATDLDPEAIARAEAGVYAEAALEPFDAETRRQFFCPAPDATGRFAVTDAPRALIRFRVLNLIGPWPFSGGFDVIMCRNVVIYFDAATQDRLWQRFAEHQRRAGDRLYIGHSESLSAVARSFYRSEGVGHVRRAGTAGPAGAGATHPDQTGAD
jgi:chemotaxis protein methyltransferase CheR